MTTPTKPAPSFRDKESYSELFKPLPKPEPIPTLGGGLRVGWNFYTSYSFRVRIGRVIYKLRSYNDLVALLQCTMLPLSTKSCLKSSKFRSILNGQFFHAISKNIDLNLLGSKQPREILVFVILKL